MGVALLFANLSMAAEWSGPDSHSAGIVRCFGGRPAKRSLLDVRLKRRDRFSRRPQSLPHEYYFDDGELMCLALPDCPVPFRLEQPSRRTISGTP